jgi:SET domain-containing protein
LLLAHAYKNLNQDATSEVVAFTINNLKGTSLFDLMEIDKDMVLSMVKEQLNH